MYISMSEVSVDVDELNSSELEEESQKFVFKIADRLANPYPPDLVQLMHLSHNEEIFMSPHLFESLMAGDVQIQLNPFKNDVFALGLVVLEMGLFESVQTLYDLENGVFNFGTLEKMKQMFYEKYDDSILKDLLDKMLEIKEDLRLTPFRLQKALNGILASLENEEEEGMVGEDGEHVIPVSDRLNEIVEKEEEEGEEHIEIYSPEVDEEGKQQYFAENEDEQEDEKEESQSENESEESKSNQDSTDKDEEEVEEKQNEELDPVHFEERENNEIDNQNENQEETIQENVDPNKDDLEIIRLEENQDIKEDSVKEKVETEDKKAGEIQIEQSDVTRQYLQNLENEFAGERNSQENVEQLAAGNIEKVEIKERRISENEENGLFASNNRPETERTPDEQTIEETEEIIIESGAAFNQRDEFEVNAEVKGTPDTLFNMENIINPEFKDHPNLKPKDERDLPFGQPEPIQTADQPYPKANNIQLKEEDIPISKEQDEPHIEDQIYNHNNIDEGENIENQKQESLNQEDEIFNYKKDQENRENFFNRIDTKGESWEKLETYKQVEDSNAASYIDKEKIPKINEELEIKRESEDDIPFDPNLHQDYDAQKQSDQESHPDEEIMAESDVEEVEIPKEIPKNNGFPDDKKFEEKHMECPKTQNYFDNIQKNFEGIYQNMNVNPHIDGNKIADPQTLQELEEMNERRKNSHIKHLASMAKTQSGIDAATPQESRITPAANIQKVESEVTVDQQFERKETNESDVPYQPRISNPGIAHLQQLNANDVKKHILDQEVNQNEENKLEPDKPFHHSIEVTLNQITSFTNKNTKLLKIENESTLPVATEISLVKDSEVFNRNNPVSHTFGEPGAFGAVHQDQNQNAIISNKTNVYGAYEALEQENQYQNQYTDPQVFQRKEETTQVHTEIKEPVKVLEENNIAVPERNITPHVENEFDINTEENVEFTFQKKMAPQIAVQFQQSIQKSQQDSVKPNQNNIFNQSNDYQNNSIRPETITGYQIDSRSPKNSFRPEMHEEIQNVENNRPYPVISNATQVYQVNDSTGSYRQFQANSFNKQPENKVRQEITSHFGQSKQTTVGSQEVRNKNTSVTRKNIQVQNPVNNNTLITNKETSPRKLPDLNHIQMRKSADLSQHRTSSNIQQTTTTHHHTHTNGFTKSSNLTPTAFPTRKATQNLNHVRTVGSYRITINPETKNKRIVISSSRSNRLNKVTHTPIITTPSPVVTQKTFNQNFNSQRTSQHRSPIIIKSQKISVSASSYTPSTKAISSQNKPMIKTSQVISYNSPTQSKVTPAHTYNLGNSQSISTSTSTYQHTQPKVIRRSNNLASNSRKYSSYRQNEQTSSRSSRIIHISSNQPENKQIVSQIEQKNTQPRESEVVQKVTSSRVQYTQPQARRVIGSQISGSHNQGYRVINNNSQQRTSTYHTNQKRIVISSNNNDQSRAVQRIKIDKKPFVSRDVVVNGGVKRSILQPKRESSKNLLNSNHYQKIINQYNPICMLFY